MDLPETPEGVALYLFTLILDRRKAMLCCSNHTEAQLFALFRECLRAANGCQDASHGPRVH